VWGCHGSPPTTGRRRVVWGCHGSPLTTGRRRVVWGCHGSPLTTGRRRVVWGCHGSPLTTGRRRLVWGCHWSPPTTGQRRLVWGCHRSPPTTGQRRLVSECHRSPPAKGRRVPRASERSEEAVLAELLEFTTARRASRGGPVIHAIARFGAAGGTGPLGRAVDASDGSASTACFASTWHPPLQGSGGVLGGDVTGRRRRQASGVLCGNVKGRRRPPAGGCHVLPRAARKQC
jgi:hypothetical protein